MRSRKKSRNILGILVLFISLFQFSCSTIHEIGYVKARPMSDSRLYKKLQDSSLVYKTMYVKRFSANYTMDGIKKSFKGSIKIQKDSLIWISITAPIGGCEVCRLMISPDSVIMITRHPKKTYFIDDFDFLSRKLNMNLNFKILQSALTNSVFEAVNPEKEKAFIRKFNGKVIDNKYVFISEKARRIDRRLRKDKLKNLSKFGYQRIEIEPSLMRITNILVKDLVESRDVSFKYTDFRTIKDQKIPQRLSFNVHDPKHLLSCNIKFNKVILDQKLKFSFKIAKNYKRVYPE
jgi:hypothetical protein